MKTGKEIEKICKSVDPKKETVLVLHVDEEENFDAHFVGDRDAVAAGIATILYGGCAKDADHEARVLAKAIIDGILHVVSKPSVNSAIVLAQLIEGLAGSIKDIEDLKKKLGFDDDDDDSDDDENCEECENNRWCPLPDAIKYRKENHIPAPKKGKKNGKRGGKKNNDAN